MLVDYQLVDHLFDYIGMVFVVLKLVVVVVDLDCLLKMMYGTSFTATILGSECAFCLSYIKSGI